MTILGIKPIETLYRGYKFRSRLEARWAVFFDTLGFKYEYEKEGFELSTGERYLPDFYLPEDKLWVEVKGDQPNSKYVKMLKSFSDQLGSALLLAVGIPGENQIQILAYDTCDSGAGNYDGYVDIVAAKKGRLQLVTCSDSRVVWDRTIYSDEFFECDLDVSYLPNRVMFHSVAKAVDAAKSARFEFGETPR